MNIVNRQVLLNASQVQHFQISKFPNFEARSQIADYRNVRKLV